MNQKKNAFTLIELLAVIVILAIIALIAVPVIMNIINKANKSAFKDTAYGIISAGELYFAEQQLEPMGMSDDVTIDLPDTTGKLELKGEVPTGSITITKEGKISLVVKNNRYCITKGIDDKDITITEDVENCKIPSGGNTGGNDSGESGGNQDTGGNTGNTLSSLATTSTEVPNKPACLTDGTTCTAGTPVAIKVNESETYNFYVISETDNKVTLIMDRNLGDNVEWYADGNNNSYGPTTAVAALKERTAGWTNIPEKEYTYSDDGGGNKYTAFTETMRARLLTYTEATTTLGCTTSSGSCPSWLYINLKTTGMNTDSTGTKIYGYWTSAAYVSDSHFARVISHGGSVGADNAIFTYYGVRPVITLSKSL